MLLLPEGRVVMIENKKEKGGRMSSEQKDLRLQAMYLGHEIHECRTWKRFLEIIGKG